MPDSVPPFVQRFAAEAAEALDREIVVTRLRSRLWRVSVEAGGVYATAEIRVDPMGRSRQVDSSLTVNGESRPPLPSFEELRVLLDQPQRRAEPSPMPDPVDPSEAPELVRRHYEPLAEEMRKSDNAAVAVTLGRHGRDGWQIAIDAPDKDVFLRFRFHKFRHRWHMWMRDDWAIEAIMGGVNYSRQIGGDASKALALLRGAEVVEPTVPGAVSGPAPAKANNAVRTRRSVVFRV